MTSFGKVAVAAGVAAALLASSTRSSDAQPVNKMPWPSVLVTVSSIPNGARNGSLAITGMGGKILTVVVQQSGARGTITPVNTKGSKGFKIIFKPPIAGAMNHLAVCITNSAALAKPKFSVGTWTTPPQATVVPINPSTVTFGTC
jgi:hypothetical protein